MKFYLALLRIYVALAADTDELANDSIKATMETSTYMDANDNTADTLLGSPNDSIITDAKDLQNCSLTANVKGTVLDLTFTFDSFNEQIIRLSNNPELDYTNQCFNSYFFPSDVKIEYNDITKDKSIKVKVPILKQNDKKKIITDKNFVNFLLNFSEVLDIFNVNTICLEDKEKLFLGNNKEYNIDKLYVLVTDNTVPILTVRENDIEKDFICLLGKLDEKSGKDNPYRIFLVTVLLGNTYIYDTLHLLTVNHLLYKNLSVSNVHIDFLQNHKISNSDKNFNLDNFKKTEKSECFDVIKKVSASNTLLFEKLRSLKSKRNWLVSTWYGTPLNNRELLLYPIIALFPPMAISLYILVGRFVRMSRDKKKIPQLVV